MNFCFYPPPGKANVHSGNPLEPSASLYSRVHFFTDVRQKAARQKGDKKEFLYGHVITISYTHTHTPMLSNTTPWPTMEDGWQLDKKK
jgi:hypothetical protein